MRHRYLPDLHHRHALRLRGNPYAPIGVYFVTLVSHHRLPLFGSLAAGAVDLSDFGAVVVEEWLRTETLRTEVLLDAFVVMPDHVHGIVVLADRSADERQDGAAISAHPDAAAPRPYAGLRFGPQRSGTLPVIIGQFKSATTKRINRLRGTPGAPVWQSRYYDRIVRNDEELIRIRRYIHDNPWRHPL